MNRISMLVLLSMLGACAPMNKTQAPVGREWFHEKYHWNAEDFFTDRKVIGLCKAIEANDIPEMERLIADGADVNAQGKGKMTPLMWSFPGNKLDRFRRLLELGANPNVFFESDFNTKGNGFLPGQSVTELAASTQFDGYFECVMRHGGDPALINPITKEGLLIAVLRSSVPDAVDRVQIFAEMGGDVNQKSSDGCPAIVEAAKHFSQYDVAIRLLDLGADATEYWDHQNKKLTHVVAIHRKQLTHLKDDTKSDLAELARRLTEIGESLDEAEADIERWRSWDWPSGEGLRLRNAERAERHAREAAARKNKPY